MSRLTYIATRDIMITAQIVAMITGYAIGGGIGALVGVVIIGGIKQFNSIQRPVQQNGRR